MSTLKGIFVYGSFNLDQSYQSQTPTLTHVCVCSSPYSASGYHLGLTVVFKMATTELPNHPHCDADTPPNEGWGPMFPPLESGRACEWWKWCHTTSSLDHKRQYGFHLVLSGHLFLEPNSSYKEGQVTWKRPFVGDTADSTSWVPSQQTISAA